MGRMYLPANSAFFSLRTFTLQHPGILVLTTSYPSHPDDWAGVFIAKLAVAIKKRGYRVTVVAPATPDFHGRRTLDDIETIRFGYFLPRSLERLTAGAGGIPENLAESFLAKLQLFPMMMAFLARALFESRSSDILYANWIGAGIIGAAVNLLRGNPLVVSFRGDDGYLARDRLLWRILTRWVIRRAVVVTAVSQDLMDIMVSVGAPASKCCLPRFGVDMELFRPPDQPRRNLEKVRVLFVGSLIPKKGLQDLIVALSEPEFMHVSLMVVGDGFYASPLKSLCETSGLKERTQWRGILKPGDVAEAMRDADILCLPSHTEGSPNVVKEAMASGLPVVATRVGGIPDMVQQGITALLYEPGDIEGLRTCLRIMTRDPRLREQYGRTGRELLVESGSSWDSTAEEFDGLFRRLLEQHPRMRK